jgi:OPA family glycerol-3-phosphate transporter-like MFS transporter
MAIQTATKDSGQVETDIDRTPPHSYGWLAVLVLGYIGIYLCRKNLSVANPMLRTYFGVSREQIGIVASVSTIAYAAGKFLFGPVIDRVGGRFCFFASLLLVALFGAVGGTAGSVAGLVFWYSCNRLAGSAAWGSMMKMVPDWFAPRDLSFASGLLSLGFVFGGVCATLLAGEIAAWSSNNWRVVMSLPSAVLLLIILVGWFVLPQTGKPGHETTRQVRHGLNWSEVWLLLKIRQFWVVCALSFALTLMRETFNTWTVDFFKTEGGAGISNRMAAFMATPFDAFGAVGIVTLGWAFGRMKRRARNRLLFAILLVLTVLVYCLPSFPRENLWLPTVAVAFIGFLAYGPYSLLAGVLSVEIQGKERVGTVAGIVDGVGYIAGILAGQEFGKIVDVGGYKLGFHCLASLTLISAILCLFLYPKDQVNGNAT